MLMMNIINIQDVFHDIDLHQLVDLDREIDLDPLDDPHLKVNQDLLEDNLQKRAEKEEPESDPKIDYFLIPSKNQNEIPHHKRAASSLQGRRR